LAPVPHARPSATRRHDQGQRPKGEGRARELLALVGPATAVAWQRTPTAVGHGPARRPRSPRPDTAVPVVCHATAVAGFDNSRAQKGTGGRAPRGDPPPPATKTPPPPPRRGPPPPPPPPPPRPCERSSPLPVYCARPCVDRSVLWSGAKTVCSATKPAPLAEVSTMPCCAASPGNSRPTSML